MIHNQPSLFAVINVGASAFRMVVSEVSKTEIKEIDYLVKPLRLGVDTFSQGYISLEHVKQAAEILSLFKNKLDEYGIVHYKAVCTSGVREARNKDFFIDYVRIHSGIELEILEPTNEIYMKYLAAKQAVKDFDRKEKDGGVLFANIASGTVGLFITKGLNIIYSGTLPYGSLMLRQMFLNISPKKRYRAYDQYIDNMVRDVKGAIGKKIKIKHLVGSGSSINLLIKLFSPNEDYIKREQLEGFYKRIRAYTREELMEEVNLRPDEVAVLIPTLCLYLHLLSVTGADRVHFTKVTFPTILTLYSLNRLKDKDYYNRLRSTFLYIGDKYNINLVHSRQVARFTKKIFTELKEVHSLSSDHYRILETSALLYQVGGFIDKKDIAYNSYYIIKSMTIPGWSNKLIHLTACTIYQMGKGHLDNNNIIFNYLTTQERLLINKLSCMLGLAISLDSSKTGIIEDIDISLSDNNIIIYTKASKEPFVEIASFIKQKTIFVETFGIPIDIQVKVYDL